MAGARAAAAEPTGAAARTMPDGRLQGWKTAHTATQTQSAVAARRARAVGRGRNASSRMARDGELPFGEAVVLLWSILPSPSDGTTRKRHQSTVRI